MVAGRLRSGPAADVTIAIVFLAATVLVGTLIVRQLTAINSPSPASSADPASAVVPASRSALSIALSVLSLPDGQQLRVGDPFERVSPILQKAVETAPPVVEQGRIGQRITRRYRYGSIGFTLVLERFEQKGDLRIAAIYIQ